MKNSSPTFEGALKAVAESREKWPDKAVVYLAENGEPQGWASVLGGGSLPVLKGPMLAGLGKALAGMKVVERGEQGVRMRNEAGEELVWVRGGGGVQTPPGMKQTTIAGVPGTLVWVHP